MLRPGIEDAAHGRRRVVALVVVLAAVLRIAYVAEIHDHPYWLVPLVDAADYHARAMQVARGDGLGRDVYYKAPAYAWLVGQLYRVAGPHLVAAYIVQMLGGVLAAGIVAGLACRWFGLLAGLAAGTLAGLYGPLVYFENQLLIEAAALGISVAAVWLLDAAGGRDGPRGRALDLAAGAAAGLALQLRPVNVALVAALAAAVLLHPAAPWRRRLVRTACLLVPVLLAIVPTARHNRVATGRLVPISVNGGINFYIGNNPDYDATVAVRPGLRWEELTARFDALEDPVRWQRNYYRASWEWMRTQPGAAAALVAKKLVLFWNRREIDRNQDASAMQGDSTVLRRLSLPWSVLAPLGIVGLALAWGDRRRLPLHGLVGWQMLGVLAFFVTSRYRLVAVPWLALAGGLAVQAAGRAVAARDRRRLAALGAGILVALVLVLPDWYGLARHDFGRPDFDRAEVLARRGDRDGALAAYGRAVRHNPDDPDVRFRYGEHLQRFDRDDEALAEYRRAAELAPWSYKPSLAIGAARLEAGDLDGAWEALAEAERRGDPHGRALYDMALVRERQGRAAEALDLHRRSLEKPDERRETLRRRLGAARALVQLGRGEAAEVEFAAAAGLATDPVVVPVERAEAWWRAGDAARALASLEGVPGVDENARAQLVRARILLTLGRSTEARRAGLRALALDPGSPAARAWLDRLGGSSPAGLDSVRSP